MNRKHYCTQTKFGYWKQCPFVYIDFNTQTCCGFHNTLISTDPILDRDNIGLKGNENCVFSSWKNKLKGVWKILFFQ